MAKRINFSELIDLDAYHRGVAKLAQAYSHKPIDEKRLAYHVKQLLKKIIRF
ncbi:hypothetical protein [Spirosoma aerolatum]|uniref:hypothetical protein n=1 Tax=Spirosoma aerolatum TaxID=1211326 RepID=UPI0012D31D64|nr:hypothetical protein [Spirosoma aerolatum]